MTLGAGCTHSRPPAHPVLARSASAEEPPTVFPQWVSVPAGSGWIELPSRWVESEGERRIVKEDRAIGIAHPLCVLARPLTVAEYSALMGQLPGGNCGWPAHRYTRHRRGEPAIASQCDWDAPALVLNLQSALEAADALSRSYGLPSQYGEHASSSETMGGAIRLLTEEEWEWAASGAGRTRLWSGTDDLAYLFLFYVDAPSQYRFDRGPTGTARYWPNVLGLYDMTGNAPEVVLAEEGSATSLEGPVVVKGGRAFESPSHSGRCNVPQIADRRAPGRHHSPSVRNRDA